MADIYYEKVESRIEIEDGEEAVVVFGRTTQPYEDLTFWVSPADPAESMTYDMTVQLNGVDTAITASATTALPQQLQYAGIFPPQSENIQASIVPSLKIENSSGGTRAFIVLILGRVYGAASL